MDSLPHTREWACYGYFADGICNPHEHKLHFANPAQVFLPFAPDRAFPAEKSIPFLPGPAEAFRVYHKKWWSDRGIFNDAPQDG